MGDVKHVTVFTHTGLYVYKGYPTDLTTSPTNVIEPLSRNH